MPTIKSDQADTPKDIICHCSGTTKQKIIGLLNDGCDNLETISRRTGASAGCGACETWILDLLAEYTRNLPRAT